MKHKHHIIPRHMGGSDDPENIVELSVPEHAAAHLKLYEDCGKVEDLCAYYMLSGKNNDPDFYKLRGQLGAAATKKIRQEAGLTGQELFYGRKVSTEELLKNSSLGGKVQGKKNAESGHMLRIQRMVDHSALGKRNAEICRQKQVNAYFDPVLRKEICKKGGKTQGKQNAESGHLKKIAQMNIEENPRTKGKIWITDGIINKMILPKNPIPEGFKKGKTQKNKK